MTDGNIIYASESVTSLLEHLPVSTLVTYNEADTAEFLQDL